jgi:hypothetical protein
MAEYQRDQFRTDPSIALNMAYKVAENNCTKSGGSTKRDDGSKEHTVSYDIWISDGEITKVEEQSEHSNDEYDLLQEQKQAVASYSNYDEWPNWKAEKLGEPPFPDRRVFITYGGCPYISITISFARPVDEYGTGSIHHEKTRTFAPMKYTGDRLCHDRITKIDLVKWFREFVPGDGNDIHGEKDVDFVSNSRGSEKLKHRVVRYLLDLPHPNAGETQSPKQNCVFEPSYISNLVNVTHRYGRVLCRQLIEEEKWPITKLDPPGDNTSFEFDTYVVALERYWGDADEYDYSTYKYRSAEKLTNEPIWIV